jgi:methionine synthase II (cobalamin-independent)
MRKIENDTALDITGTSLKGYVRTTLAELTEVFGAPTYDEPSSDNKVNTEWTLLIDDVLVTVYNWKTGETPTGLYDWHVGGHDSSAEELVQDCIEQHRTVFAD